MKSVSHLLHKLKKPRGQSSSGQIVVEYVLLLMIGVTIAMLLVSEVVSRNPDDPGFLMAKWHQIIQTIGQDYADDLSNEDPGQ